MFLRRSSPRGLVGGERVRFLRHMSKTSRACKIDDRLLLHREAQPTIQVRNLQWDLRVGMFVENVSSPTGVGPKVGAKPARRRRTRIQLAGAAGVVLAGSAFGLHQYTVWHGNSLGPQLQAWAPAELGTPQHEVDRPWELSHLTQVRHGRIWQRVRVRFPSRTTRRNEVVAQLGQVDAATKLAPASNPSPSADLIPLSNPAFDPPLTAGSAKSTQFQPQRDPTARKHIHRRHQSSIANFIRSIDDGLRKAWRSVLASK
jgi:hypothetical protein